MRTVLFAVTMALVCVGSLSAQAVRFDTDITTVSPQCVSGKVCPINSLPGTTVNFCSGQSQSVVNTSGTAVTWVSGVTFSLSQTGTVNIGGQPYTIRTVNSTTSITLTATAGTQVGAVYSSLTSCLASPATTYTNFTAVTPCATTAQLTPQTGGACLSTADLEGNAGGWFLPGQYSYYLRVPATAGGGTYGPYPINVGASAGCPSGATCDANYATLSLACTAAGTGSLYISRTWAVTPSQTLCSAIFLGNGKIVMASSAVLTVGGTITAAVNQQIFDTSASGSSVIAGGPKAMANPISGAWFTSAVDGTTDNSVGVQAAFSYFGSAGAGNPRSGRLILAGPYVISATIQLKNFSGEVDCQGWGSPSEASPRGNYIVWKTGASSGIPMFQYDNTAGMHWIGCQLIGNVSNPPSAALNCKANAFGGGAANQLNQFDTLKIGTLSGSGQFQNGILIDGANANCDTHQFNNAEIRNTGTAFNQQNSQNVNWNFVNLQCVANTVACINVAGTVNLFGGSMASNGVDYTFQGSGTNPIIVAFGVVSDGSGRWVDYGTGARTSSFLAIGGTYNISDDAGAINDGTCGPSADIAAGTFVIGKKYIIVTVGSTNWVAIGAASNTIGVSFTATGAGSGTGTADYPNCSFFVKAQNNYVAGITFRSIGVKINGNTVLKAMFGFGEANLSGSPRSVTVEDATTTCPNALLDTTSWLITTATGASSKQYYHFQGCENWTYRSSDAYGTNSTFQPTDGVTEEFYIHAQTLTLPTVTPVTFTPVLKFGGSSTGITYSQQWGSSVVVGNLTYVNIAIQLSSKGAQTGVATMDGLPAAQNNGNNAHFGASFAYASFMSGTNAVIGGINEGTGRMDFYSQATGTSSPLTDANFTNTTALQFTLVYSQ